MILAVELADPRRARRARSGREWSVRRGRGGEAILLRPVGSISARSGSSSRARGRAAASAAALISRVRSPISSLAMIASSRISSSAPVELRAGSVSIPSRSAARAIAIASIGSDLPRSREARRRPAISCGAQAHDPLAAVDQKPLQAARHVPAVLDRPHPLCIQRSRPLQQLAEAAVRAGTRRCARAPRAERVDRDRTVCVRLCVSAPITIMSPSLRLMLMKRTPGGHISVGALPRSLSVQDACCNRLEWHVLVVDRRLGGGGAWARWVVVVGCARALSLISVLGPWVLWAGDMMVGGVIPLGYALRPLGL